MKRLSRATGWVVAGGVAMTGVFSVAAAHSFSGKASSDGSTEVVGATDLQPTAGSTGSSAATGTLTPPSASGSVAPAQAPGATGPATTAAPATSGVTAPPETAAPATTVAPPVQTVRPSRRRAAVSSGGS